METSLILAGDIGGTNTRLGLFESRKASLKEYRTFQNSEYSSLEDILMKFLGTNSKIISKACFGVAGPVLMGQIAATNLPWIIDEKKLSDALKIRWVKLINDLEANAYGIAMLGSEDFALLNEGKPVPKANTVIISAGTGLGEAVLYWNGKNYTPIASEGGHCDFAPRNELEVELWQYLHERYSHISYERILSGPGLQNVYNFLKNKSYGQEPDWLAQKIASGDPAAEISQAALSKTCDLAVKALDIFTQIYGAEAGNLGLKVMALGGVYLGGGIALKIIEKLKDGSFMTEFVKKGRMENIMRTIPVRVILNDQTAILGAARKALEI